MKPYATFLVFVFSLSSVHKLVIVNCGIGCELTRAHSIALFFGPKVVVVARAALILEAFAAVPLVVEMPTCHIQGGRGGSTVAVVFTIEAHCAWGRTWLDVRVIVLSYANSSKPDGSLKVLWQFNFNHTVFEARYYEL